MAVKYDAIIIGAGMSGLASGIRLAMFDKKVVILESHSISGGLNSYYSRRIKETKELINLDVGLHALTNFAKKGDRKKPFGKLLKQLRIPYDSFQLQEQTHSLIRFKSAELRFSNDFELLRTEVYQTFGKEIDSFDKFTNYIHEFNEVDLNSKYLSARSILDKFFFDELLKEMIIAPLLIYGSAWENDMDFAQFAIMFKSLYFEGFSRPKGGVRTIIDLLLEKYKEVGGEIRFRTPVESIETVSDKITGVSLKNGERLLTKKILSSAGFPETLGMLNNPKKITASIGRLSFTESIFLIKDKKPFEHFDSTIVFYNETDQYNYQRPSGLIDKGSAVICFPDNYERENTQGYGLIRVTHIANYNKWKVLEREKYLKEKEKVFQEALSLGQNILSEKISPVFKDVFSPLTVQRYTGHFSGTVYGSTTKCRDGRTEIEGLYIIGTDQGFLGIVGSLLSGISMANLHGLMD